MRYDKVYDQCLRYLSFSSDSKLILTLNCIQWSIADKCLRTLAGLFSLNLLAQLSCKMGLVLACVVRILHGSIRLGENRSD